MLFHILNVNRGGLSYFIVAIECWVDGCVSTYRQIFMVTAAANPDTAISRGGQRAGPCLEKEANSANDLYGGCLWLGPTHR